MVLTSHPQGALHAQLGRGQLATVAVRGGSFVGPFVGSAAGRAAPGNPASGGRLCLEAAEDREQRALFRAQLEIIGSSSADVTFIDLHTTSGNSDPFVCFGDTPRNRQLARCLPMTAIVGLDEVSWGTMLAEAQTTDQAALDAYTADPRRTALADELIRRSPSAFERVYFVSGGSEAIEAALPRAGLRCTRYPFPLAAPRDAVVTCARADRARYEPVPAAAGVSLVRARVLFDDKEVAAEDVVLGKEKDNEVKLVVKAPEKHGEVKVRVEVGRSGVPLSEAVAAV